MKKGDIVRYGSVSALLEITDDNLEDKNKVECRNLLNNDRVECFKRNLVELK